MADNGRRKAGRYAFFLFARLCHLNRNLKIFTLSL